MNSLAQGHTIVIRANAMQALHQEIENPSPVLKALMLTGIVAMDELSALDQSLGLME